MFKKRKIKKNNKIDIEKITKIKKLKTKIEDKN